MIKVNTIDKGASGIFIKSPYLYRNKNTIGSNGCCNENKNIELFV